MNEKKLVEQLKRGEKRALRRFYKQAQPKLLRWVRTRVTDHDDAQEIVHDAFMAFLDSLPLFRGNASLETFLTSIAKHEVADYWRKKYAKKAIMTVPFMDQVYTEKLHSAQVTAQEIEQAYARLSDEQRFILILKYEENKTVEEIAQRLKISAKAAESRLFRARGAFKLAYASLK